MKLGIIGIGAVGSATAMAAALRARVREIVLIDLDRARAKAVATDMHYGVALSPMVSIRDGDYADLDAKVAIAQCQEGNPEPAIPVLEQKLRDNRVTVPARP